MTTEEDVRKAREALTLTAGFLGGVLALFGIAKLVSPPRASPPPEEGPFDGTEEA